MMEYMKGLIKIIWGMDMVSFDGMMDKSLRDNGEWEQKMVMEYGQE